MSRTRVAYLVTRFPKLSETFIVDEILALERQGVDVDVFALRPGPAAEAPAAARDLVRRRQAFGWLSPQPLGAQLYWLVRAPRRLLGVWWRAISQHLGSPRLLASALLAVGHGAAFAIRMQRRGVDRVHAHWATHSALAAWVVHRLTGLPYSITTHADDLFVRRPMLAEKVSGAEFVVTISDYNRRFLVEQLGDRVAPRVRVVHCGVDTSDFRPLAAPRAERPFTIACVGRLEPKKGHRVLLDACTRLVERGIDFRCILIGNGTERGELERRIDAPALQGRVELRGAQPRSVVRGVLAEAHALALPCIVAPNGRADGIPVALMEAMALARPVVTTRISGIPELVQDGVDGLLVAAGDAEALADALERLQREPAFAARLAAAGRRRVEKDFDLERNVARLAVLFASGAPDHPMPAEPALQAGAGAGLR